MHDKKMFGYYGHHKCATTWIRQLVDRVCEYAGRNAITIHSSRQFGDSLRGYLDKERIDFVSYTNAEYVHVRELASVRGFHVIRDPRDIIVSAYFSHRNSHPTGGWNELLEYRQELQSLDMESGLLRELRYSSGVMNALSEWQYDQAHILEMRFEDLVRNPFDFALAAFGHLGLIDERAFCFRGWCREGLGLAARRLGHRFSRITGTLPSAIPFRQLLSIVHELRFSKLSGGRAAGVEDQASHFRKGLPGDWQNHFTPKVEQEFKSRFDGLLKKLGYEKNEDWHVENGS